MIVCPSCRTHYRQNGAGHPPGAVAHCSRCDESFPLAQRKRTYRIAPSMAIGMDDPRLAERLRPRLSVAAEQPAQSVPSAAGELTWQTTETELFEAPAASAPFEVVGRDWELELTAAVVPSSIAAGAAYYLAVGRQAEPFLWAALAGASGLLLGRVWLLWVRRRNP